MFITTRSAIAGLREKYTFSSGLIAAGITDGRIIVVGNPKHHAARFLLAEEPGVTVLPGQHDPAQIGDSVAAALAHVKAKPTETMREVALRLHAEHGPAFHPDT